VRPGDHILGEEGGESSGVPAAGPVPAPVRWIVDPLDGTVNYLYGLHDWSVSIAAEVAGTVVAGVVDVPLRGEVFTAVLGKGAWLHAAQRTTAERTTARNASALHCTSDVPLEQALVATGFGYEAARRVVQGEVVAKILPRVRDIRRGGSAAVELCSVAAGRVDAFYERGLNYWDYAAGGLIAREAGATVAGLSGRSASSSMTLAAGPGLFTRLDDLLTSLDPERDA
jgi:myo-inositol-1(or 4)-monophosphatase